MHASKERPSMEGWKISHQEWEKKLEDWIDNVSSDKQVDRLKALGLRAKIMMGEGLRGLKEAGVAEVRSDIFEAVCVQERFARIMRELYLDNSFFANADQELTCMAEWLAGSEVRLSKDIKRISPLIDQYRARIIVGNRLQKLHDRHSN